MRAYPHVLGEVETLRQVLAGRSLARYGDGEFKLCEGRSIKSQAFDPELRRRLYAILHDSEACLVGIPNIHSDTPKADFWGSYRRVAHMLEDRPYVSSFVTRPDSAPWIDTAEYWDQVESLWRDRDVTLVRGTGGKCLTSADLDSARSVTEILCPRQSAFAEYDEILERVGRPERAILCLGPTATVLAVDLCERGVHAIDLGHIALFLRKFRRGVPMMLSREDKVCP